MKNFKKKFQKIFISEKNKIILDKDGKEEEREEDEEEDEEEKEEKAISACLFQHCSMNSSDFY